MTKLYRTLLLLLAAMPATGQFEAASVTGFISDPSGSALSGAKIALRNESTGVSTTVDANAEGAYNVPLLRPGLYEITVASPGFKTTTRRGITLRIGDRVQLDLQLEIGTAVETLTVTGRASGLETQTSSNGQVIDNQTIVNLPLNGRNYLQLGTLTAGTVPAFRSRDRTFSANGNRGTQNAFLLDGTNNIGYQRGLANRQRDAIRPSVDALAEFKVLTSNFSAEYGQSAGAVIIATIKSGTNQLHGSVYEFLRNWKLDALPYFQQPGTRRPLFLRNQFGAAAGAPIRKDRLFVFGSWESTRIRQEDPRLSTVPSAALRRGDFSEFRQIFDPATLRRDAEGRQVRDMFPGNVVPQNRFSPLATRLLDFWPAPNLAGRSPNYSRNPRGQDDSNRFDGRLDYYIKPAHTIFVRGSWSDAEILETRDVPPPAQSLVIQGRPSRGVTAGYTAVLNPRTINEFRFGYGWNGVPWNATNPRDELGIPGTLDPLIDSGTPTINITGLAFIGTGANVPAYNRGGLFEFSDSLSRQTANHVIRVGATIEFIRPTSIAALQGRSGINFNGVFTQNLLNRAPTGEPFADFLLAIPNSVTTGTLARASERGRRHSFYVQDDWRLTRRFTLNLGLRYELVNPYYEIENRLTNLILESGDADFGKLVRAGSPGRPRSLVNRDNNNFAPRLGFAWQLGSAWVVRGGAGMFYGQDESNGISTRITNNPPNVVNLALQSDQVNPSSAVDLRAGIDRNIIDPARVQNPNLLSNPSRMPLPYVTQWTLNVQRSLPKGIVLQTGYVGSAGSKLIGRRNANQALPGAGAVNPRRPLPLYGDVGRLEPRVRSSYEGLNLQAEKRFAAGLSFLAAFTYGHSIDTGSATSPGETDGGVAVEPPNANNVNAEKASSDFDVRRRFSGSMVYDLPFGKGRAFLRKGPLAWIAGHWTFTAIYAAQTGGPFTPGLSFDPTNTGSAARPNRLRDGNLPAEQRRLQSWFDLAAFAAPAQFVFGSAGRNILRGPGLVNGDMGLYRRFSISESRYFEFRGELFNVFNTPNFENPGRVIGTPQAGQITSTLIPNRQIQLGLKFLF